MPHIQPDPTPPYDVTAVTAAADRAVEASGVGVTLRRADGRVQVVFPQSTSKDDVHRLWAEMTGEDLVAEFDYIRDDSDDLAALIVVEGPEIGPIGDIDGGGPTPRGLYPLRVSPGTTTTGDLIAALADVPAGAVLMSAGGDLDTAVIELVDMTVPCDVGGGA